MSQQAAEQAHEISQMAQAVSEAINGLGEINKLVEQVKECAAPKPKAPRYINGTEILGIALKASEVIDAEFEKLSEKGVKENTDSMERIVVALAKARTTGLRRQL